jgi:hypothetical protein
MPIAQFTHISTTPRSATTDTTILEFLRRAHPNVTFEGIHELADVNPKPSAPTVSASTNLLIAYNRNPDKLTLEIPQPFEQFPAQERGLEFIVPAHGRCGGVIVYYPLSVVIMEGV